MEGQDEGEEEILNTFFLLFLLDIILVYIFIQVNSIIIILLNTFLQLC